ncbi:hypothetical protein ACJJTC_001406 [Scirpophaga incertulas]
MASTSGGKEPPDIGANDGNEMEINYVPSPGGFVTLSEDRLSSSSDTDSQVLVSYHDFTLAQAKKRKVSVKNKEHQSKRVQITSCENVVDISNSQSSYTIPLGQREKQSVLSGVTDSLVSSDKSPPQTVSLPFQSPSGRQAYKDYDKGPYVVHIQKTDFDVIILCYHYEMKGNLHLEFKIISKFKKI